MSRGFELSDAIWPSADVSQRRMLPETKSLALWRGTNANGIGDKGEVKPVADWNIVALGLRQKRQGTRAWIGEQGVTFANGETRPTYDWLVRTRLVEEVASVKGATIAPSP
ncbi:MAG: hypothetical protein ABL996_00635 [Micropepsaceae bacterium]